MIYEFYISYLPITWSSVNASWNIIKIGIKTNNNNKNVFIAILNRYIFKRKLYIKKSYLKKIATYTQTYHFFFVLQHWTIYKILNSIWSDISRCWSRDTSRVERLRPGCIEDCADSVLSNPINDVYLIPVFLLFGPQFIIS